MLLLLEQQQRHLHRLHRLAASQLQVSKSGSPVAREWPGHGPDEWLRCNCCVRVQRWSDLRPAHFKDRPNLLIAVCAEPDENCARWQLEMTKEGASRETGVLRGY